MKVVLALAAAAFVISLVVSGLTPLAPATSANARNCSKERCQAMCRGKCSRTICEMCTRS